MLTLESENSNVVYCMKFLVKSEARASHYRTTVFNVQPLNNQQWESYTR